MGLDNLDNKILNCKVKDETGLNDFQKLPAEYKISIPRVGVNRFRIPLNFFHKETSSVMNHDCFASLYVNLRKEKTGINMSRLCQILTKNSLDGHVDFAFLNQLAKQYQDKLRDDSKEDLMEEIKIKLDFSFPLKQKSLKSDNWGWQYYKSELETIITNAGEPQHFLTVNYEYSSTCPCSLSMSKQYEEGFRSGEITEGSGIATAHSQRSGIKCKVRLTDKAIENNFFIEELVAMMRTSLPTETQSIVKRLDEQAFAVLNGSNPMFVEHACKRVHKTLEDNSELIADWSCFVEHWESLHSHNAAAAIYKNIAGGLRELS